MIKAFHSRYVLTALGLLCFMLVELSALVSVSVDPVFGGGKVLDPLIDSAFWSVIVVELSIFFGLLLLLHVSLWLAWLVLARGLALPTTLYVAGFIFVLAGIYFMSAASYPVSAAGENITAIYGVRTTLCGAVLCFALALLLLGSRWRQLTWRLVFEKVSIVLVALMLQATVRHIGPTQQGAALTDRPERQPNLIVIGIDSLRYDLVQSALFSQTMPTAAAQFRAGAHYTNAYTSVARTFVSWSSVLTGKAPLESGIRVNLQAVPAPVRQQSLGFELQRKGYNTVVATDERRFANIEQGWGFDTVLGPKAGVADFIWGEFADFPLLNVFRLSPLSAYVFPYLADNRALESVYLPEQFSRNISATLERLDRARPLFLAAHLCLAHWPFVKAPETSSLEQQQPYAYPPYLAALALADQQLAEILQALAANGFLDDAIVMLFSDHGESFKYDAALAGIAKMGHGSNIFNVEQNKTPVVIQRFVNGQALIAPAEITDLLGLHDFTALIKPTAAHWASAEPSRLPLSLKPRSYVPLETGFNPVDIQASGINVATMVQQGIDFYDITDQSRLVVNQQALVQINRAKQLGVTDGKFTVGRIPSKSGGAATWYYWDIDAAQGDKLDLKACAPLCEHVAAVYDFFGEWL